MGRVPAVALIWPRSLETVGSGLGELSFLKVLIPDGGKKKRDSFQKW